MTQELQRFYQPTKEKIDSLKEKPEDKHHSSLEILYRVVLNSVKFLEKCNLKYVVNLFINYTFTKDWKRNPVFDICLTVHY
jgi:hypothetical protein